MAVWIVTRNRRYKARYSHGAVIRGGELIYSSVQHLMIGDLVILPPVGSSVTSLDEGHSEGVIFDCVPVLKVEIESDVDD